MSAVVGESRRVVFGELCVLRALGWLAFVSSLGDVVNLRLIKKVENRNRNFGKCRK